MEINRSLRLEVCDLESDLLGFEATLGDCSSEGALFYSPGCGASEALGGYGWHGFKL